MRNRYSAVYFLLILVVGLFSFYFSIVSLDVKYVYDDVSNLEYLNNNTQRFISLTVASNMVDDDIRLSVREDVQRYLSADGENSLSILSDEAFVKLIREVILSWDLVEIELDNIFNSTQPEQDLNYINLFLARESYNKNMSALLSSTYDYSKALNVKLRESNIFILMIAFGCIMVIFAKSLRLRNELNICQNIIDSTGLSRYGINSSIEESYSKEIPKGSLFKKKSSKAEVIDINEFKDQYLVMPSNIFGKKETKAKIQEIPKSNEEDNVTNTRLNPKNLEYPDTFTKILMVVVFIIVILAFTFGDLKF